MAWLRIDDGYTSNSKIAQLTDVEFRVWMRLLCHCARSHDPSVDSVALREVAGLDKRRVSTFSELGLIDSMGDSFEVHDWVLFLPKEQQKADRQARWRARKRAARVDAQVDEPVDDQVDAGVDASASRTCAGTRGVPSRPVPKDQNQRASDAEAKDAHRPPAEIEEDPEPQIDDSPEQISRVARRELERLRAQGAST
jgi:hypothetical protein